MLLGELFKRDGVESLHRERIALGLCLRSAMMSDVVDNSSLRNETKTILREAHVEYGVIAHKHNQRKVKMRKAHITVKNDSAE